MNTSKLQEPDRDFIIQAVSSLPLIDRTTIGLERLLSLEALREPTAPVAMALTRLRLYSPLCPTPEQVCERNALTNRDLQWPDSVHVLAATSSRTLAWGSLFTEALIKELRNDRPLAEVFRRASARVGAEEILVSQQKSAIEGAIPAGRYRMSPQASSYRSPSTRTPDAALIIPGASFPGDRELRFQREAEFWRSALSITYRCPVVVREAKTELEIEKLLIELYERAPGGSLAVIFLCHGKATEAPGVPLPYTTPEGAHHQGSLALSPSFSVSEEWLKALFRAAPQDAEYTVLLNSCYSGALAD